MGTRAYVLLRSSDRARLRERVAAAAAAWADEWLAARAGPALEECVPVARAADLPIADGGHWLEAGAAGPGAVWAGLAAPAALTAALLGAPADPARVPTALELALLDRALADLCRRLTGAEAGPEAAVEPAAVRRRLARRLGPGAEGALIRLKVADAELAVVLAPGAAQALAGRDAPVAVTPAGGLARRAEALATVRDAYRRATAGLGTVALTVADLASLSVGDVIRLDARVGDPVKLDFGGAGQVLDASLGTMGGAPAIRIRGRAQTDDNNDKAGGP